MINLRRLSTWAGILGLLLLISGCAGRPFLSQDNSYSIIKVSPVGEIQKTPIQLTWNSNAAVMQKLLLEASFVLSDLHTLKSREIESIDTPPPDNESSTDEINEATPLSSLSSIPENQEPKESIESNESHESVKPHEPVETKEDSVLLTEPLIDTVLLEANFPQTKRFNLMIDGEQLLFDISSLQIEVKGKNPGRVILNREVILQGIRNPNLVPSFDEFIKMLNKTKEKNAKTAASL